MKLLFNVILTIFTGLGGIWLLDIADETTKPGIIIAMAVVSFITCFSLTAIVLFDIEEETRKSKKK